MQYGRQRGQWDQTAAMIVHFRRALGDKETKWEAVHPHYIEQAKAENRKAFKALSRAAQEQQRRAEGVSPRVNKEQGK